MTDTEHGNIYNNFFSMLITEEYVCSYIMPLCKDDPTVRGIESLPTKDYVKRVLADKPEAILKDDYLD